MKQKKSVWSFVQRFLNRLLDNYQFDFSLENYIRKVSIRLPKENKKKVENLKTINRKEMTQYFLEHNSNSH